ncbi:MAG: glutamate-5-semialdehyde dehydrogenase [Clostridia bacterium]|nr:glutamate-5-semialdehyde dehydrogenase [Clostridia bacterium]
MNRDELIANSRKARGVLPQLLEEERRIQALGALQEALKEGEADILKANRGDLERGKSAGLSDAMLDRLLLTKERLCSMVSAIEVVKTLPDPLGVERESTLENGLLVRRCRVPLGVIGMIYEARPNVTADAAALAIKSGNGVILRGGKEALETNKALVGAMRTQLSRLGLEDLIYLIEDTDRSTVDLLLSLRGEIDLVIPRGGAGLIRHVVDHAKVPVIETGAGNCHVYVHKGADLEKALRVLINAKTSRPSVCNAAETLLCDEAIAPVFLKMADEALSALHVELRAQEGARVYMPHALPASEEDFATEYNDYILAVRTVSGIDEALSHIARYSTGHSEAILTEDGQAAEYFLDRVDAAAVYHNASTRFTDGGVFGMGAEIGISTQKLHTRGPFAMESLTTIKYKVKGNGQVR